MLEELQRRNLSPITTRIYLRAVEEFAQYYNKPPDRLGPKHIRQYQAHLFTDRKLDAISVAQQLSALRFFFLKTLKRPWIVEDLPVPKKPIRLPEILSQEEVERLIQCANSPLHRVCILTLSRQGPEGPRCHAEPEAAPGTARLLAHGKAQTDNLPVP